MRVLITNPMVVGMAIVAISAAFAFLLGVLLMRRLRRSVSAEAALGSIKLSTNRRPEGFALEAYQGVIQRLKEQEKDLQRLRDAESERAAASENISAAVLSNLASGVVLFNPAGLVQQANVAAKNILGYASPLGLHARDIFRGIKIVRWEEGQEDSSSQSLVQALESALREGTAFRRIEAHYSTPSIPVGEARVLGITISPVRGAGGEPLGAACLISNLTEITRLGAQMRTRESMAALGEMSAGIAHEFKNSLATISGYAQMLASENDCAVMHQFAEHIAAETRNLTRIVTDFLNFARPQDLQFAPVDLREVLESCSRECEVELDLRKFPPELSVQGDSTALRQAICNLLRNSAEAARDGSRTRVAASTEFSTGGNGNLTKIVLRDNGCGIPVENLAKIFIPFYTTKAQGTGLGLALVHRIMSEHGGAVAVESDASGTSFILSFPAEKLAGKAAKSG